MIEDLLEKEFGKEEANIIYRGAYPTSRRPLAKSLVEKSYIQRRRMRYEQIYGNDAQKKGNNTRFFACTLIGLLIVAGLLYSKASERQRSYPNANIPINYENSGPRRR